MREMRDEELLRSFLQSLLSENTTVDEDKVNQILQYILDKNIPLEVKVFKPQTIGVKRPDEEVIKEIAENVGIPDEEIDAYLGQAMNKIAKIIGLKLYENKEPETELEKQIINKFYDEDLKTKFALKLSPMIPIYEGSKLAEGTLRTEEGPIKYYALQIIHDRTGNGELENFFIALTKKELVELAKLLQEVIEDGTENSS
ncbi:hypothetical protein E3E35_07940 [Thermococcus sp. GR7]|uniref:hypothetical protein n=1 Tax=unclassified Thermococcus TaxID=2627626 RepID=UPI0014312BF4|nr:MULTISPECIES: hypothetical protein [unclassified Thermococcus]NJE47329.1 hypothetical protein [Thermococcus sp. GR7]NJE79440.1 hypothetical protein [Thermococcus sp. GR4]NJF23181.1 hypothetical protein [Thermococcus sp. GR5]